MERRARLLAIAMSIPAVVSVARAGAGASGAAALRSAAREAEEMTNLELAAGIHEKVATRFPGTIEGEESAEDAIRLLALGGRTRRAVVWGRRFIAAHARHSRAAARVAFALAALARSSGGDRDEERWLVEGLARTPPDGRDAIARRIQAHARLAALLWRRSCRQDDGSGICGEERRLPTRGPRPLRASFWREHIVPVRCGPIELVMKPRTPSLVARARHHLGRALELRDTPAATDARGAVAEALFLRAEVDLDGLLRDSFPADLDLSIPSEYDRPAVRARANRALAASRGRLATWLERKTRQLGDLEAAYAEVAATGGEAWRVAASARMARAGAAVLVAIWNAPVPAGLKEVDPMGERPIDRFCEDLARRAAPLEAAVNEWGEGCLRLTVSRGLADPVWSDACAGAVHAILASEAFAPVREALPRGDRAHEDELTPLGMSFTAR